MHVHTHIPSQWLTLREAADAAGFKYGWAWDRFATGRLAGQKDPTTGRVMIDRDSLVDLLKQERHVRPRPMLRIVIDNTK